MRLLPPGARAATLALVALIAGATIVGPWSLAVASPRLDRQLWVARYDSGGPDHARSVAVSPDGASVFVAGMGGDVAPPSAANDRSDFLLQAYDATTGAVRWAVSYSSPGAPSSDDAYRVAVAPDGSAVVATGTIGGAVTLAFDPTTGDELWRARYVPADPEDGWGISEVAFAPDSGSVFVSGRLEYLTPRRRVEDAYLTIAYDVTTGDERWVATYTNPAVRGGWDRPMSLASAPDGSTVFVTGMSEGDAGYPDYATVAYEASTGAERWVSRFDSWWPYSKDEAFSVAVDPAGSAVYVTGRSEGRTPGMDFATLAYDASTGARLWLSRYSRAPRSSQQAFAIAVAPDGGAVFVTGRGNRPGHHADVVTVSYGSVDGDEQWVARFDGPLHGDDQGIALVATPDGAAICVTGWSTGIDSGRDYATLSYDASTGSRVWIERLDGDAGRNDRAGSIAIASDGASVFVTGYVRDDPAGGYAATNFGTVAYRA